METEQGITLKSEFNLGEIVWDDLTRERVRIIGIQASVGVCNNATYHGVVWGYWVDHFHAGGGRYPWEISKLKEEHDERESNP